MTDQHTERKHAVEIHGTKMVLQDRFDSLTLPFIVRELENDVYGLEQIKLGPDDIFVDVGANIGIVGIYAHLKFGCKVIAFEPVGPTFWDAKQNIKHNEVDESKFKLLNFAVTDLDFDIMQIHYEPDRPGNASAYSVNGEIWYAPTISLRRFLKPTPTYLKIDCEGEESKIIEDCKDLLGEVRYIGIEIHSYNEQKPHQLLDRLRSLTNAKIFYTFA